MGTLHMMVNSRESEQTARFRWKEGNAFYFFVVDSETGVSKFLGDGEKLFCDEDGANCLKPGTQMFYHALNSYFEHEQAEIAEKYFEWTIEEHQVNTVREGA